MPPTTHHDSKLEVFWRDLITRWKTSGQTVAAFCTAHRVSQPSFYSWRRRLATRNSQPTPSASPTATFASVRVVPDPTAEVLLPTGVVVRVPAGADPQAVARLVAALGGGLC
jgi:hypothetical protein